MPGDLFDLSGENLQHKPFCLAIDAAAVDKQQPVVVGILPQSEQVAVERLRRLSRLFRHLIFIELHATDGSDAGQLGIFGKLGDDFVIESWSRPELTDADPPQIHLCPGRHMVGFIDQGEEALHFQRTEIDHFLYAGQIRAAFVQSVLPGIHSIKKSRKTGHDLICRNRG